MRAGFSSPRCGQADAIAREVAVEIDLHAPAALERLGHLAARRHGDRLGLGVADDVGELAGA